MPRVSLLKFLTVFIEGGTEGQVMNLVDRLDLSRFALRFACFNRTGRFLPLLEARAIPVTQYTIKRLYDLRADPLQLRNLLHDGKTGDPSEARLKTLERQLADARNLAGRGSVAGRPGSP